MTTKKIITMTEENIQACKNIAEEIEQIAKGGRYYCPECGELITVDSDKFNESTLVCPECGKTVDVDFLGAENFDAYFDEDLDVEYRISSDRKYRSVKIQVFMGGPYIYVDTADAMVKLYSWDEYAEYPISDDARNQIDTVMKERFYR